MLQVHKKCKNNWFQSSGSAILNTDKKLWSLVNYFWSSASLRILVASFRKHSRRCDRTKSPTTISVLQVMFQWMNSITSALSDWEHLGQYYQWLLVEKKLGHTWYSFEYDVSLLQLDYISFLQPTNQYCSCVLM